MTVSLKSTKTISNVPKYSSGNMSKLFPASPYHHCTFGLSQWGWLPKCVKLSRWRRNGMSCRSVRILFCSLHYCRLTVTTWSCGCEKESQIWRCEETNEGCWRTKDVIHIPVLVQWRFPSWDIAGLREGAWNLNREASRVSDLHDRNKKRGAMQSVFRYLRGYVPPPPTNKIRRISGKNRAV